MFYSSNYSQIENAVLYSMAMSVSYCEIKLTVRTYSAPVELYTN